MTLVITALVCLSSGWFLVQENQPGIHGNPSQAIIPPLAASSNHWNILEAGEMSNPADSLPTNSLLPLAAPLTLATNSN